MSNMRDLKRRIRSIKSTQHITRAMKMVAAAKLRRAQEQVLAARPYTSKLGEVIDRLMATVDLKTQPLAAPREVKKVCYVLLTADRGLAGGYNANLIRLTTERLQKEKRDSAIVAVGSKGRDFFRRSGTKMLKSFIDLGDIPQLGQARELACQLMDLYLGGTIDELHLIYSHFHSVINHEPLIEQLLPIIPMGDKQDNLEEYIYEPSPERVLQSLLPRYCEVKIYQSLLESKASEHGARMTAMDSATNNAGEMIEKLTLFFNRARQAAITGEILEVVAGADALK